MQDLEDAATQHAGNACPVCASPYRAEIEGLQAGGYSYPRIALALAAREVPVPDRDAIAAHAAAGHLLTEHERSELLHEAAQTTQPGSAVSLEAALDAALQSIVRQIQAGDLSRSGSLAQVATTLLRVREAESAAVAADLAQWRAAFMAAVEAAHRVLNGLRPVLGDEGTRQQRIAFDAALRAELASWNVTSDEQLGASCAPDRSFADRDGVPWAAWDRERLKLFRDYLGDELLYERFLADLRADPARYYPPLAGT